MTVSAVNKPSSSFWSKMLLDQRGLSLSSGAAADVVVHVRLHIRGASDSFSSSRVRSSFSPSN